MCRPSWVPGINISLRFSVKEMDIGLKSGAYSLLGRRVVVNSLPGCQELVALGMMMQQKNSKCGEDMGRRHRLEALSLPRHGELPVLGLVNGRALDRVD
ncbi:hypothetical protein BaRGS_00039638 [Batillaria attramentaria]|uniref:Uncharacterized protein n=1 Tax=Batillaria attramentaria TaxID=370345 RepID=A0ABD0J329_9CAEN